MHPVLLPPVPKDAKEQVLRRHVGGRAEQARSLRERDAQRRVGGQETLQGGSDRAVGSGQARMSPDVLSESRTAGQ